MYSVVECGSHTTSTDGQVDTSNGTTIESTAIYTCFRKSGSCTCSCMVSVKVLACILLD